MPFCVYLNNQSVRQVTLLPNGQKSSVTRYIFIEGRDLPIILLDDRYSVTPVINVEDGRNPRYNVRIQGANNLTWLITSSTAPVCA